jgi:hypothetical protein
MTRQQELGRKPSVERVEARALLSAITDLMVTAPQPLHLAQHPATSSTPIAQAGFPLMNPNNLFGPLAPTGIPTARELARQRFSANFSGPFYKAPPRFTSQSNLFFYRGLGGSTQFLHGDYQMMIAMPADPTKPILGAAYLQDRNINSGGAMGLDLTFDPTSLDKFGRPTEGTFTQDPNIYSGVDFTFTASGTVTIHYFGTSATVIFKGLLYTNGITDPLRNMDLQARGGRLFARS